MKILFTGKGGKSGSWAMRGEQLGAAMGAEVRPMHAGNYDVTVVVKRTPPELMSRIQGRWVWDLVDFYPQPHAYDWGRAEAVNWVRAKINALKPTAIIWPNQRMREDCDTGLPGLVLPHHHRIGIGSNPIRGQVSRVGYEGAPAYLGHWRPILEAECAKRGWLFVVNPSSLADLDIVVAFRDGSGYVGRNWKSAVKLANAHASGTPFVGQQESGYLEQATGAEYWAEARGQLSMSFDWLEDQGAREAISDRFRQKAFPVEHAAAKLKEFLSAL
jgi:hypothetical protein